MDDTAVEALTNVGEILIDTILGNGSIQSIAELVEAGAPLWYQNNDEGMSALHAAAYMRKEDIVKFLIEKGAIWNAGNLS
jgi:type IV protein arginine methyltransferase